MSSPTAPIEPNSAEPRANYFVRHWRGQLPLAVSWWVNGILASLSVFAVEYALALLISRIPSDYSPAILWISIWLTIFVIFLWHTVGVWRSATNSRAKYGKRSYGNFAKVLMMFGVVSSVLHFFDDGLPDIKESLNTIALLKWDMKIARGGTELDLTGGIGNGFTADLAHHLDVAPAVKLIRVDLANGGRLQEAQNAEALIHNRQLNTYVSSYCQSACTIIFLGGRERYLKTGAKLGFHSPSFPGIDDLSSFVPGEREYLKTFGLSAGFINHVFSTPKDRIWYPDEKQLLQEGVITSVVSGDEFALSGVSQNLTNTDFEKGVLESRIYTVIRVKEPATYQILLTILQDGIRDGKTMYDLRLLTASSVTGLVTKYSPYADERSIEYLANVIIIEINDLAKAPEPVCFEYLMRGKDVNAATRFFSKSTSSAELDAMADVIENGNLARTMPSEAQKNEALKVLISGLDKASVIELSESKDPAHVGSYRTCLAAKAMYQEALSMPEPYKDRALRSLLDRN